jgi:hypothetical protein
VEHGERAIPGNSTVSAEYLDQISTRFGAHAVKGSTQKPPSREATACQGNQDFLRILTGYDERGVNPLGSAISLVRHLFIFGLFDSPEGKCLEELAEID